MVVLLVFLVFELCVYAVACEFMFVVLLTIVVFALAVVFAL